MSVERGHLPRILGPARTHPITAPTAEEARAVNAGEYAPTGISRILQEAARSRWTPIGIGTATGIAGYAAYQNVPAIHEFVDSSGHELLQRLGLEIPTLPYFDNQVNKGIIHEGNIKTITADEVEASEIQPTAQDHNLNLVFPIKTPPGTKLQYERSLTGFSGTNRLQQESEQNKVQDKLILILPKDSVISAPFKGNIMMTSRYKDAIGDPNDPAWARLFYYDPSKNLTYVLWIFPNDDGDGKSHFYSPLEAQKNDYKSWTGTAWKGLSVVEQGQPILKTLKENQIITLAIQVYKGENVDPASVGHDQQVSLATPQFYTQKDESGQEKLLVLGGNF